MVRFKITLQIWTLTDVQQKHLGQNLEVSSQPWSDWSDSCELTGKWHRIMEYNQPDLEPCPENMLSTF